MSANENAADSAAASEMPASSTSDERMMPEGASSFEEERKLALENMEKSLTEVIQKMSKADQNLQALSNNNNDIKSVSELWHEVFSSEKPKKSSDASSNQQPVRKTSLSLNWPR